MWMVESFKLPQIVQMNWTRFVIVFLLGVSYNCLQAQSSSVGDWFLYFGNQKINAKWNWHNEIQYRNFNAIGDLEQLILRTGIGYNLSENNNNVLLGYAYVHSEPYIGSSTTKTNIDEHRIFQQFITKQAFSGCYVQHRYRIEERFIASNFRMRFRYFLSFNVPLNKKTMEKNALYLSAYDEIFLNNEAPVFDRNRVYGALGYCFSNFLKLELGMMTQIQTNNSRAQFQIAFFNNLPF
jgi:hypothetical protein